MGKYLSDSQWKPFAKKLTDLKVPDNGIQKAISTFSKLGDDKLDEKERCLAILMKLATELHRRKEVNADKPLNEDLAGLISEIAAGQEGIFNFKKEKANALKSVPRSPLLEGAAWTPIAKKIADLKISDGGLEKAVTAYQKVPIDSLPERERCLDILNKLAVSLHRKPEINAANDLNEAVAKLIQAIATDQEKIFNTKKKFGVK